MLKLQKSSLVLILIIVVLTAGCVSIYTLGYTPGTVWHKAEDVKSGTFGQNVGGSNYNFPGNVGIGTTSSSSQLDVTGNIYATKQVTAGTKFKVGVSEITSGKITGLDAPTNPSDAANKAYVDEQIIGGGNLPLVNSVHTQQDCINAGGEVVDSDVTLKQCRFAGSNCPSGWTQYKNWSTTIKLDCDECACRMHNSWWTGYAGHAHHYREGVCASHPWSDSIQEYVVLAYTEDDESYGVEWCRCTIKMPIIQIGCY